MPRRTDPRAGFMLVEVLAALVVTAALVATVLPFAGQLIARWQTGQASIIQADGWMQAVARLSDDVAETVPVHEPGQRANLAFSAQPRQIAFVRPALRSATGALDRVSYEVEDEPDGERLVRRSRPLSSAATPGAATRIVMMEGPYVFRFAAIGREGSRGSWVNLNTLPVRLDLVVTARDRTHVPFSPIVLPLSARATAAAVVPLLRQRSP